MTTDIAVTDAATLHTRMDYAKALAQSNLLPSAYPKPPANILVAIEYGEALGLAPMVAIQQISVIQGKPTMSAQLMGALVRQAGHRLRVSVDESSKAVVAELTRSDDPDFTFRSVWDMGRAQAAGLTSKGGSWKTYPLAMLRSSSSSGESKMRRIRPHDMTRLSPRAVLATSNTPGRSAAPSTICSRARSKRRVSGTTSGPRRGARASSAEVVGFVAIVFLSTSSAELAGYRGRGRVTGLVLPGFVLTTVLFSMIILPVSITCSPPGAISMKTGPSTGSSF